MEFYDEKEEELELWRNVLITLLKKELVNVAFAVKEADRAVEAYRERARGLL